MAPRPRTAEDIASFQGMGVAVAMLREQGEVNADWATLRDLAREFNLPLEALIELAEERAPGEGGEQWRRWSQEAERERDVG
jgi:hypothetical protein